MRLNDLAFSLHCNLCSTIMLAQIIIYPGDGQRVTPVCWASIGGIPLPYPAYTYTLVSTQIHIQARVLLSARSHNSEDIRLRLPVCAWVQVWLHLQDSLCYAGAICWELGCTGRASQPWASCIS